MARDINQKLTIYYNENSRVCGLCSAGGKLEVFEYNLGQSRPDEVEVHVKYCGICHSDPSMLDNE